MGVYLHAAFELFVGINFIVDPGALLDEHKPASAFEYHAWECFGISCAFWGLVLMLKANDRTVLALDVVWNTTWMAVLWTMMQGQPWREALPGERRKEARRSAALREAVPTEEDGKEEHAERVVHPCDEAGLVVAQLCFQHLGHL